MLFQVQCIVDKWFMIDKRNLDIYCKLWDVVEQHIGAEISFSIYLCFQSHFPF